MSGCGSGRASIARAGETLEQAYVREARAVRASVGITDVSTLGKIDVQGPDAAIFLDRVYTNTFSTLAGRQGALRPDAARRRLSLRRRHDLAALRQPLPDDDHDGECRARHAEPRNAARDRLAGAEGLARLAHRSMGRRRRRRAEQPRAAREGARRHRRERRGAALHGRARRPSRRHPRCWWRGSPSPASAPTRSIAAPIMRSPSGSGCWRPARNSRSCPTAWRRSARCASRRATSPAPRSTAARRVHDLGLEKMFSMKKDFVGKPLALRPALTDPGRKQLVGLKSLDGKPVLERRASRRRRRSRRSPAARQGHVTAMCYSPALEGYIALALLERGRQRHGEKLYAADPLRGRARPGRGRRSLLLRQGREPHAWLSAAPPSRICHDAAGSGARVSLGGGAARARSCRSPAWPDTLATVEARHRASCSACDAPRVGNGSVDATASTVAAVAPGRFLVAGDAADLARALRGGAARSDGAVTDLSHGRVDPAPRRRGGGRRARAAASRSTSTRRSSRPAAWRRR